MVDEPTRFFRKHPSDHRMKITHVFTIALAAICLPAVTVMATFSGSDNFSVANSNWEQNVWKFGNGNPALTQTGGVVQYTSNNTSQFSYTSWEWLVNTSSYNQSWQIRLDTTINQAVTGNGIIDIGLELWNNTDDTDFLGVGMTGNSDGNYFFTHLYNNDNFVDNPSSETIEDAFSGTVMLSYDGVTHVVTAAYDSDGAMGGYSFTTITTFGIGGSGGDINVNWNMTAADVFTIHLIGASELVAAQAGQVYLDNFVIVPEPGSFALSLLGLSALGFRRRR
jgi:hypothetical protein